MVLMQLHNKPEADYDGGMENLEDLEGNTAEDEEIEADVNTPELTMLRESYLPGLYRLHAPHSSDLRCDSERCVRRWQRAGDDEEAQGECGWVLLWLL